MLHMSIEQLRTHIPVCRVPREDAAGYLDFPGGPDSGSNSRSSSLEVWILGLLRTLALHSHPIKNSSPPPRPTESEVS